MVVAFYFRLHLAYFPRPVVAIFARPEQCFNSALVILTPHNTTVAKPFATFRYYCLMCVYARLGLTVTAKRRDLLQISE